MGKKILFIIPPSNIGYGYINQFFWQKSVLHLATYIYRKSCGEFIPEICDGNIRSMQECYDALCSKSYEAVGIYCLDHTKENGRALIERVFNLKIEKLFLGGPGIINSKTAYSKGLDTICNQTQILYCEGQGEEEILAFLQNRIVKKNSLIAKWDMSIYEENERELYFDAYIDDFHRYIEGQVTNLSYPYIPITYSTLSHIGCRYRATGKGCVFCGIPHHFYHVVDGATFWGDFQKFQNFCVSRLNIDSKKIRSIKDWGDSIDTAVLKNLLANRPTNCSDVRYSCYISCRDITVENLELLRALNCFSVYIGIDGNNNSSLISLRKGYQKFALLERLQLLNQYPFLVEIGLIVGNKGETKGSLRGIVQYANYLKNMFGDKLIVVQGNVLIPMPGSQLYYSLSEQISNSTRYCEESYDNLMSLTIKERIKLWLELNTSITYEDCIETNRLIENISPRKHSYVCS